jgi:hypothetical protein
MVVSDARNKFQLKDQVKSWQKKYKPVFGIWPLVLQTSAANFFTVIFNHFRFINTARLSGLFGTLAKNQSHRSHS